MKDYDLINILFEFEMLPSSSMFRFSISSLIFMQYSYYLLVFKLILEIDSFIFVLISNEDFIARILCLKLPIFYTKKSLE